MIARASAAAAIVAACVLALPSLAGAAGIEVTVSRTETTMQEPLEMAVTIEGSQRARPTLPELPDFDIRSAGQTTQMQWVNGRASTSITFNYLLLPKRTGEFTIGAASVELDGEVYRSTPFQIRVLEASAQPSPSRDLFLTARVSDTAPYVGQQILYTWRFYRRVQVADARLESMEFDGFVVEDLGEVREFQTTVGGVQYAVSELRKALFPQQEGTLTIPASRLNTEVVVRSNRRRRGVLDDFFGRPTEAKMLTSQPIEVEVRPLPAAPSGFSGLIGSFDVSADLTRDALKVGESTTLKLKVAGRGNVQMIGEPKLPSLEDFKVYDDKPSGSIERGRGGLAGSKSFSKALVPLAPGDLAIPAVELTYFDPEAGSYRTATTGEILLAVSPADGREDLRLTESVSPGAGKVAVRILADDILPIYKGLDAVDDQRPRRQAAAAAAGILLPPLVFLGTLVTQRRRRRFELDTGLRRRREASRRAARSLKELRAITDSAAAAPLASRTLREYIGDKLDLEGSALTPQEVGTALEGRGVEADLVAESVGLLERLEAAQYGAAVAEADASAETIGPLIKRLDRQLRG